jgi:hypothetical protein
MPATILIVTRKDLRDNIRNDRENYHIHNIELKHTKSHISLKIFEQADLVLYREGYECRVWKDPEGRQGHIVESSQAMYMMYHVLMDER